MKKKSLYGIIAVLAGVGAGIVLVLLTAEMAQASDRHDPDQKQKQHQQQKAYGGAAESKAKAEASNEGVETSVNIDGDRVENNSSNVVLVPNNNTESCIRVAGIAFGKNGESGAIGWPWRSKACDYEQAADDAFAAGERELGWFWKCQNKNLYKTFRLEGMTKDEAKHECHKKAVGVVNAYQTVDRLNSLVDRQSQEIDRLNGVLVDERQACKDAKDETYERCADQMRK